MKQLYAQCVFLCSFGSLLGKHIKSISIMVCIGVSVKYCKVDRVFISDASIRPIYLPGVSLKMPDNSLSGCKCYGVSNHWQLHCFLDNSFGLTTNKKPNILRRQLIIDHHQPRCLHSQILCVRHYQRKMRPCYRWWPVPLYLPVTGECNICKA